MKPAINHIACQYISHGYQEHTSIDMALRHLQQGVKWIQYRDKELSDEVFLANAIRLVQTNSLYASVVILNDRAHLVQKAEADGVHIGKTDGDIQQARALIGGDKVLGFTINDDEDLALFEQNRKYIDYLGVGPFAQTQTKANAKAPLGMEGIRFLTERIRQIDDQIPVVAVGGISASSFKPLAQIPVQGVAMSAYLNQQPTAEVLKQFNTDFE